MSDCHFRSLQPRNGQCLLQKSASKKVLILKKSRAKIPLVMGYPPLWSNVRYMDTLSRAHIMNSTGVS